MHSYKISYLIEEICKKEGIDYKSKNPTLTQFVKDAEKLGQIYLKLKEIEGDLIAIGERHNIEILKEILNNILLLEQIDHDIIRVAMKIKGEK